MIISGLLALPIVQPTNGVPAIISADGNAGLAVPFGLLGRERHGPSELSGGQQQRVAIARAIVTDPQVLLADEPTGNLDTKSSREIMDILTRLNGQGITVIMVTHEQDIAAYAKRNVIMRDGLIRDDHLVRQRSEAKAGLLNGRTAAEPI